MKTRDFALALGLALCVSIAGAQVSAVGGQPSAMTFTQLTVSGDVSAGSVTLAGTAISDPVVSGTYTPTLTAMSNVSGSTATVAQYMRVGDVVTVSGRLTVTTSAASTTQLNISFPVVSNLTAANQANGAATAFVSPSFLACQMEGDATNDRIKLLFQAGAATTYSVTFTFTYLVL